MLIHSTLSSSKYEYYRSAVYMMRGLAVDYLYDFTVSIWSVFFLFGLKVLQAFIHSNLITTPCYGFKNYF